MLSEFWKLFCSKTPLWTFTVYIKIVSYMKSFFKETFLVLCNSVFSQITLLQDTIYLTLTLVKSYGIEVLGKRFVKFSILSKVVAWNKNSRESIRHFIHGHHCAHGLEVGSKWQCPNIHSFITLFQIFKQQFLIQL